MINLVKEIFSVCNIIFNLSAYLFILKVGGVENNYFADKLICNIKESKNVYWKLSQWITSRLELQYTFDNSYLVNRLKNFYEKCPHHDFKYTRETIENFYDKKLKDIFYDFSEYPEASGSIGQIHTGTLIKNNKKVAVKIRHPNIEHSFKNFCSIIIFIQKLLKYIFFLKKLLHFVYNRKYQIHALKQPPHLIF